MAFSGHYFCGALNGSNNIEKVPLYYWPEDILPYCDEAINVASPGSYLGHLWAPAKDPSRSDSYNGYKIVTQQPSNFLHNFEGNFRYDDIDSVVIHGGNNGTVVKTLSCTVNFYCDYGAKSDGWCGSRIYLRLDGTNLNSPHHVVKSWGGTHTLSYKVNNISIPSGDHILRLGVESHASGGDSTYFRVNWYSFLCDPIKRYCVPSIMHLWKNNKEYVLCKSLG